MNEAIEAKVNLWLSGNFDEVTKKKLEKIKRIIRLNWQMHFIRTWNLAPVACVV